MNAMLLVLVIWITGVKKKKPNLLLNNFVSLLVASNLMVVSEAPDIYRSVLQKLGLYVEYFFHS